MTEFETYEHILTTASALIAEQGFARTSMNDIVRESGLSKGGVYWHFKSKDDIILAVVDRIFNQQMAFLEAALTGKGNSVERLMQLLQLTIASLEETDQPMPSPIDVYALALRNTVLSEKLKNYFKQFQIHLTELIEQGVEEGVFIAAYPKDIAMVFIATIEGILLVNQILDEPEQLVRVINQANDLFLNGLRNDKGT